MSTLSTVELDELHHYVMLNTLLKVARADDRVLQLCVLAVEILMPECERLELLTERLELIEAEIEDLYDDLLSERREHDQLKAKLKALEKKDKPT